MTRGGKAKYAEGERCHVPGCNRPVHARGVCSTHYMQVRRGKEAADLTALQALLPERNDISEDVGVLCGLYSQRAAQLVLDALHKTAPVDLAGWIERNIKLPPGHGYRGSQRMDFNLYPHMRFPLSLVDNPDVERIVLCFSAQSGKTDTLVAITAYLCGHRNLNGMYVLPTQRMMRKVPKTRFESVFKRSNVGFYRAENDYTLLKFENGCFFSVALASAPDSMAEQTGTGFVVVDEHDEYFPAKHSVIDLSGRRLSGAARPLMIIGCTPKHLEEGYTYSYFENSRRYELEIECPHCGQWFIPDFEKHFRWPTGADHRVIKAEHLAYLECPNISCGGQIPDSKHFDLVTKRQRWRCLDPHLPMLEVGLRVPVYMTVTKNWSDVVSEYLKSADDPLARADFWNSVIAKPKRPDNQLDPSTLDFKHLLGTWSQEQLEIPAEVIYVTAAVDCGAHELWLFVMGWGIDGRKYELRTERIDRGQGWDGWREATGQLLALCELGNYTPLSGYLPSFEQGIIDSGDGNDSALVYDFCRANPLWKPAKGQSEQTKLFEFSSADPRNHYRGRYRGLQTVNHATHQMQDLFHNALQTAPGKPGGIQFAADAPAVLFVHIKNQLRVPVVVKNVQTYKWQKIGQRDDHLRDAAIGAMLAGYVAGLDKLAYAPASESVAAAPALPNAKAAIAQAADVPPVVETWADYDSSDYLTSYSSRL